MLSEQIQSAFRNFLKPILRIRAASSATSPESSAQKPVLPEHKEKPEDSESSLPSNPKDSSSGENPENRIFVELPEPDPGSHGSEVKESLGILSLFDSIRNTEARLTQGRARGQYQRIQAATGGQKKLRKGALYDQKAG